jgi:hypothetical protein
MLVAILALFILPFFPYDIIPTTQSPIYKVLFWLFVSNFLILMFLGGQPAAAPFVICSKLFTLTYFSYLLLTVPCINFMHEYVATFTKKFNDNSSTLVDIRFKFFGLWGAIYSTAIYLIFVTLLTNINIIRLLELDAKNKYVLCLLFILGALKGLFWVAAYRQYVWNKLEEELTQDMVDHPEWDPEAGI